MMLLMTAGGETRVRMRGDMSTLMADTGVLVAAIICSMAKDKPEKLDEYAAMIVEMVQQAAEHVKQNPHGDGA
ncbi:MAG: hypothetical protein J6V15_00070 [Clostridia bacterium]|nr:hypothetical protein [Clostridia bacterium]